MMMRFIDICNYNANFSNTDVYNGSVTVCRAIAGKRIGMKRNNRKPSMDNRLEKNTHIVVYQGTYHITEVEKGMRNEKGMNYKRRGGK